MNYFFYVWANFVSNAIFLCGFRLKTSINEFIPETYKLMNATEKLNFVNDIYKGESLSLSSGTKFEKFSFNLVAVSNVHALHGLVTTHAQL